MRELIYYLLCSACHRIAYTICLTTSYNFPSPSSSFPQVFLPQLIGHTLHYMGILSGKYNLHVTPCKHQTLKHDPRTCNHFIDQPPCPSLPSIPFFFCTVPHVSLRQKICDRYSGDQQTRFYIGFI